MWRTPYDSLHRFWFIPYIRRMKNIVLVVLGLCVFQLKAQNIQLRLDAYANLENVLYEDCGIDTAQLVVFLDQVAENSINYSIAFDGTAVAGADYEILDIDTTIEAGERLNIIEIAIISDGISEGSETIIVSVTTSEGQQETLTIELFDALDRGILPGESITICQNEVIDFNTAAASSYEWTDLITGAPFSTEQAFSLEVKENIDLLLTKMAGTCTTLDTVEIELIAGRQFPESDTSFLCLGAPLTIGFGDIGSETTTFTIAPEDDLVSTTPNQIIFEDTISRWYAITIESASCLITDSIYVRVDSLPDSFPIMIFEEKLEYCPGEKVELFTSSSLPNRNFPDIEFLWTFDAGILTEGSNTDFANLEFTTVDTSVFRRMTTNNACEVTDSVKIDVLNPPVILNFTDTTLCADDMAQIDLINEDQFISYQWMPEDNSFLSCTDCPDPVVTAQSGTTDYMLMVMAINAEGDTCPFSASLRVTGINEEVQFGPLNAVCPGTTVELSVLDPDGRYSDIQWSGDVTFDPPTGPTTQVTINEESTITVQAVQENGCRIEGSSTIDIIQPQSIPIMAVDIFCEGESIDLSANFDGNLTDIRWTSTGNAVISDPNAINTSATFTGTSTIEFTATKDDGCTVLGSITRAPVATQGVMLLLDPPMAEAFPIGTQVGVTYVSNSIFDSFGWTFNGNSVAGMNDSIVVILDQMENIVVFDFVTIAEQGMCPGRDSIIIRAEDVEPLLPNAFSPNEDEMNDMFRPYFPRGNQPGGLLPADRFISLKIFNRWGENIFETSNSEGWDGTVDGGDLAPPAVYAYVVVYIDGSGDEVTKAGDVTLLR